MRKVLISFSVSFLTVISTLSGVSMAEEVQPAPANQEAPQSGRSGGGAQDLLNSTKPVQSGNDDATKEGADRLAVEAQKAQSLLPMNYNNGIGTGNGVANPGFPNTK